MRMIQATVPHVGQVIHRPLVQVDAQFLGIALRTLGHLSASS